MFSFFALTLFALTSLSREYSGPEMLGMIVHQPTEMGFSLGEPRLVPSTPAPCPGCGVSPGSPKFTDLDDGFDFTVPIIVTYPGVCDDASGTCRKVEACNGVMAVGVTWVGQGVPGCTKIKYMGEDGDYITTAFPSPYEITISAWIFGGCDEVLRTSYIKCGDVDIASVEIKCKVCDN